MYSDRPAQKGVGEILPLFLSDPIAAWSGDSIAAEVEKQHGGAHSSARLQKYASEVGNALVSASDRKDSPYKFTVLADPKILNAFALGNGNVYITYGLMRLLENEAEFASVLGHEIGHVAKRHINKAIEQSLGTGLLLDLAKRFLENRVEKDELDELSELAYGMVINGYSRSHELEADQKGLQYSVAVGYDPFGIVGVMKKFEEMEPEVQSSLEYYLRSHPLARERVSALESRINTYYPETRGVWNTARYRSIVLGDPIAEVWSKVESYALPVGIGAGLLFAGALIWRLTR